MKRIVEIKACKQKIPLKTPFITALRRVDAVEFVRVWVYCDDGSCGIGEAPPTKAITGEDTESILNAIASFRDILAGMKIEDAFKRVHSSSFGSSAKACLDIALFSLLYGFKRVKSLEFLQTDITISLNKKEKMLLDAHTALSNGMDILKVKLAKDIKHAIEVTKELSKLDAKLIIDANQAWSVDKTLHYIDEVERFGIELIEQPVVYDDLDALKKITQYSPIPILADEAVFTLEDVKKVLSSKSADMINIKLMKCGGVTKAKEILEYARDKNVLCMLGSMLEGPISINAALYLAFEYSDVIKYIDLDSPLLYKGDVAELEFVFEGAKIKNR